MEAQQDLLDIRGRTCPLPVIDIYHKLKQIDPGETLCVLTSDAGSPRNFRAFCRRSGHEFIDAKAQGRDFAIYIRKRRHNG